MRVFVEFGVLIVVIISLISLVAARYARCVEMDEIEKNDFNLNISRYISTAVAEEEIDLSKTNAELVEIEKKIKDATSKHNKFLKELDLPLLPS